LLCSEDLVWVHFVFWPMAAVLTFVVARHNHFGLKDALLAAVGMKKFDRTFLINVLQAVTLLLPLGLALWIIQSCST
jgi:hypothetical protein